MALTKTGLQIDATPHNNLDERLCVGRRSVGIQRRGVGNSGGRVMVLPPFGVPAAALAVVADLIVAQGRETVLVDPRDSNGTGSGEIVDFRLSTLVEDCRAAIEHYRPDVVLAVSLSARAAARALAELSEPCRAVFLLPVVDVRSTLAVVLERDWFEVPLAPVPPLTPVLGSDIRSERFRSDCLELGILSAASMCHDLARIDAPVTLLPGTEDPWIDHSQVAAVVATVAPGNPALRMRSLVCDEHELQKHPGLAVRLIREAVAEACGERSE